MQKEIDSSRHKRNGELYRVTTLRELGPNLPVPQVMADGSYIKNREFSFLEWDMAMEETLSKAKIKAKTEGLFISQILSHLVDNFCGSSFQDISENERLLKINQNAFANSLYMYMYLRVEEMGPSIRMDVGCTNCGELNKDWYGDLNDLEVRVKDLDPDENSTVHKCKQDFTFRRPIIMEDKKIITGLTLDMSKWEVMEKLSAGVAKDASKLKKMFFENSIVGCLEKEGPIEGFYDVQAVIGKMKKVDIELCIKEVMANNAGPLASMQGECKYCGTDWYKEITWASDSFLDSSSL